MTYQILLSVRPGIRNLNRHQTVVRRPGLAYNHNQTVVRRPGLSYNHNQTLIRR